MQGSAPARGRGAPESRRVFGVLPKTDLPRSAPTMREAYCKADSKAVLERR